MSPSLAPQVKEFFDRDTWTLTYVVFDSKSKDSVVIDPVWDYDPASSSLSGKSAQLVVDFVKSHGLYVRAILETHAHADHISGAQILKNHWPHAVVGIGAHIGEVQGVFKKVFNLPETFKIDGSQFDLLLDEKMPYQAGTLEVKTIFTPGHTPACASYLIGDALFTGDALFMPDFGTGRCDFPAGCADQLYSSVHEKLYKLPEQTRVFTGHDYLPGGRALRFQSTIGEEKQKNIQLNDKTTRQEFVDFRNKRDKTLAAPRLLLPSVQMNIDAGKLPPSESTGGYFLKIPLRLK